jgi:hypothetical protein
VAIGALDGDDCGPWDIVALENRPAGLNLVKRLGIFGRVLHGDKQRCAIGREARARRFRPMGTGEQQFRQAPRRAFRVDAIDAVGDFEIIGPVSGHEHAALRIEGEIVRIHKPPVLAGGGMELGAMLRILGIAGKHEQIPGVGVRRVIGIAPAAARRNEFNDVAIVVLRLRVRRVELVARHLLVPGHDGIDAARHRIGFHILRTVHGCRTQRIGGQARLEQHLGLRGKALVRRERAQRDYYLGLKAK